MLPLHEKCRPQSNKDVAARQNSASNAARPLHVLSPKARSAAAEPAARAASAPTGTAAQQSDTLRGPRSEARRTVSCPSATKVEIEPGCRLVASGATTLALPRRPCADLEQESAIDLSPPPTWLPVREVAEVCGAAVRCGLGSLAERMARRRIAHNESDSRHAADGSREPGARVEAVVLWPTGMPVVHGMTLPNWTSSP